jgi:hypothetical protein
MKKINLSFNSVKKLSAPLGEIFKKIPWILGMHAFLCIIVAFILAACLGEFLFYNDVYLTRVEDPEAISLPTRFNEQVYQSVVEEWQVRETLFASAPNQTYSNPFNK